MSERRNAQRGDWNWRYLAYCDAHGRTPDEQLVADEALWPGGKMTGFILWNSAQWEAFAVKKKLPRHSIELALQVSGLDRFIAAQLGGHEA